MSRADGPFVVRLAKEPGRRESRYMHLFSGAVDVAAEAEPSAAPAPAQIPPAIDEDRLARLELLVDSLCKEIEALKQRFDNKY